MFNKCFPNGRMFWESFAGSLAKAAACHEMFVQFNWIIWILIKQFVRYTKPLVSHYYLSNVSYYYTMIVFFFA